MGKGAETKERILNRAFVLAAKEGLAGLSLGTLAGELDMSKSGLFAHFRSKEDLQIKVLQFAAHSFEARVLQPAFRAPRGLPRVERIFDNWLRWLTDPGMPGGCLFLAASIELDDQDSEPRAVLLDTQQQMRSALAHAARLAVEEGHFRADIDCEQLAFELFAIALAFNHWKRLLRASDAETRARAAFARLVGSASA
jgi:AcrR family transcriptional regulator